MLNIVLLEPEIPHNTGAIARTCAATGARLHLIKPLGFDISDKAVKRCGLDYWHLVDISVYENLDEYLEKNGDENLWLATTKAPHAYCEADLSTETVSIMLGKETAGLPEELRLRYYDRCIRIPMISDTEASIFQTRLRYLHTRLSVSRASQGSRTRALWPNNNSY